MCSDKLAPSPRLGFEVSVKDLLFVPLGFAEFNPKLRYLGRKPQGTHPKGNNLQVLNEGRGFVGFRFL